MSIWTRDPEHEKRYGYPIYRACFGAWPITITPVTRLNDDWGVNLVNEYDEFVDGIGRAPTLHAAQKLALEWVLKQIVEASTRVEEAAKEWQAAEEAGER